LVRGALTPHKFRELEFANPRTDNYIDDFSDLAIDERRRAH
jgi:hypothetical protein